MEQTVATRMPLIGDSAPSFKAVTTQGVINFPEDYKGKWVILFSHPADFTPVCTTEFMTFASMIEEFRALNTELVGLSVDSLYAHIAWLRRIQELEWKDLKNIEVTFPLIEDIRMEVANKYGMIQPVNSNTQAVRPFRHYLNGDDSPISTIRHHRQAFDESRDNPGAAEGDKDNGNTCRLAREIIIVPTAAPCVQQSAMEARMKTFTVWFIAQEGKKQ